MFTISELNSSISPKLTNLLVSDKSSCIYKIYRMYAGDVVIKNIFTGELCEISNNTFAKLLSYRKPLTNQMAKYINSDLTAKDLNDILDNKKFVNSNCNYYQNYFAELASLYIAKKEKKYTTAFIHLYRILEKTAYVMPMLYATRTKDFSKSYSELRKFFSDTKQGELGFMRKFLDTFFDDTLYIDISIDIDLKPYSSTYRENIRQAYLKYLPEESIHPNTNDNTISIKFKYVCDAIITIRNKVCHSLNDSTKMSCKDFVSLDLFFQQSIEPFILWNAIMFLEIMKFNYNLYAK